MLFKKINVRRIVLLGFLLCCVYFFALLWCNALSIWYKRSVEGDRMTHLSMVKYEPHSVCLYGRINGDIFKYCRGIDMFILRQNITPYDLDGYLRLKGSSVILAAFDEKHKEIYRFIFEPSFGRCNYNGLVVPGAPKAFWWSQDEITLPHHACYFRMQISNHKIIFDQYLSVDVYASQGASAVSNAVLIFIALAGTLVFFICFGGTIIFMLVKDLLHAKKVRQGGPESLFRRL